MKQTTYVYHISPHLSLHFLSYRLASRLTELERLIRGELSVEGKEGPPYDRK